MADQLSINAQAPRDVHRRRRVPAVDLRVRMFGYLLMASALMSYVPDAEPGTALFAAVLGVYSLYVVLTARLTLADRRSKFGLAFVLFASASVFTLVDNGYGLYEWFRAIIPFLFFLTLLYLPRLNADERSWLARALFAASMIWLGKIIVQTILLVFEGSDVLSVRLTFRVADSVLPFPLVAIPYLLFVDKSFSTAIRWALLMFILYMYVWIGYRAGLALVGLVFLFYTFVNLKRFGIIQIGLLATMVAGLISLGAFSSFSLLDRFDALSQERDGSRELEWIYAIDQFKSSPIIGKGMGWQVPADITFYGVEDTEGTQAASVGYVHSAIAYFAMNLGLIGLLLYLATVMPNLAIWRGDDLMMFSSVALGILLLYGSTQASFRLIQTVLMTVALIKINAMPIQLRSSSGMTRPSAKRGT